MTIASAPGKVIISGEHSVVYGKPALAGAIDLRCRVELKDAKPGLTIHAKDLDKILRYDIDQLAKLNQGEMVHSGFDNLAMAALSIVDQEDIAYEISISSDIPIGAGLGSSAATSVAIVGALFKHLDMDFDRKKISSYAYEAEKIAHGTPSGIDNSVSALGGLVQFHDGEITTLELDQEIPLLIINSTIPRNTKALVSKVRKRKDNLPKIMNGILDQMGELSLEIKAALLENNYEKAGELFDINQGLLSSIGVNHPKLEELVTLSREAGAYGAKLTGAGGGGCMIALLPREKLSATNDFLTIPGVDIYQTSLTTKGVVSHE